MTPLTTTTWWKTPTKSALRDNCSGAERRVWRVQRGRLGVTSQNLAPDLAEALGVDAAGGAILASVDPGTPADAAGLTGRALFPVLRS